MIDYVKIGRRIAEERKHILRKSQEQMATDLFMYQADISNIENAKSGSGITDLSKLDTIADYLGLPIENLLFGTSMEAHMIKYYGKKMEIVRQEGKPKFISNKQNEILKKIEDEGIDKGMFSVWTCGPYTVYILNEVRMTLTGFDEEGNPEGDPLGMRWHIYTFFNDTVIANMMVNVTDIFHLLREKEHDAFITMVPPHVVNTETVVDIINPFISIWKIISEQDEEQFGELTEETRGFILNRMDDLRPYWKEPVMIIESVYVREDCREHGICRLMMDILRKAGNSYMVLNLEPTLGEELDKAEGYFVEYTEGEVGQLNLNAVIAEKLGFTIHPETELRSTKVNDMDGNIREESVQIRKLAYVLPKGVREIVEEDGFAHDILAKLRDSIKESAEDQEVTFTGDVYTGGWWKYGYVAAVKMNDRGKTVYAYKRGFNVNDARYGVSYRNPGINGEEVEDIERYDSIDEAMKSRYAEGFAFTEALWLPMPDKDEYEKENIGNGL